MQYGRLSDSSVRCAPIVPGRVGGQQLFVSLTRETQRGAEDTHRYPIRRDKSHRWSPFQHGGPRGPNIYTQWKSVWEFNRTIPSLNPSLTFAVLPVAVNVWHGGQIKAINRFNPLGFSRDRLNFNWFIYKYTLQNINIQWKYLNILKKLCRRIAKNIRIN